MDCELVLEYLPTLYMPSESAAVAHKKMRESLFKSDGKEFKRFCLLTHVPNQKFTIGTTYVGREEQGVFIYCPLTGVLPSHCQIFCDEEDGLYSIQAVEGAVVLLNDQVLTHQEALRVGDTIRLTSNAEKEERVELEWRNAEPSNWLGRDRARKSDTAPIASFMFIREHKLIRRKRQIPPPVPASPFQESNAEEQPRPISGTLPFDYVVLRKILRFLPLSDLKACRLVSTFWKSASTPHFLQRSTLCLHMHDDYTCLSESRFFHFMNRKVRMAHPNLHLSLPRLKDISSSQLGRKCLDDLTWLLSEIQGLRRLRLGYYLESEEDHSMLAKIFDCVAHGLEELDFKAFIQYKDFVPAPLPPSTSFPNLTKFCSMMNDTETFIEDGVPWITSMSTAMNKITHLEVKELSKTSLAFLDTTTFPRVASISCSKGVNVAMLQQMLLGKRPGLRVLELVPNEKDPFEATMLTMELVRKHANTLEVLALHVPRKAEERLAIDFPVMPNLRTLSIKTCPMDSDRGNISAELTFLRAPRADYGKHFPKLEALSVLPQCYSGEGLLMERKHTPNTMEDCHGRKPFSYGSNSIQNIENVWEESGSVFEPFFSEEIRTRHYPLLELNVPYALSVEVRMGEWTTTTSSRIPQLASMFPNVNNICFRQSRNQSYNQL